MGGGELNQPIIHKRSLQGSRTYSEGGELDDLPGGGRMHRDEPPLPKIEDVAGVRQLVLMLDRDDLVPLTADVLAELNVGPERKEMESSLLCKSVVQISCTNQLSTSDADCLT